MDRLLNVTAGLGIVLLVLVLISVRRSHIRVEYSVSWLIAAAALLLLSRARGIVTAAGDYLGLPESPIALLIVSGAVFLIMFFRFSVILSKLRDDNIALAQRVAILEFHIGSLRDQAKETESA
jgi:hypothetical protein